MNRETENQSASAGESDRASDANPSAALTDKRHSSPEAEEEKKEGAEALANILFGDVNPSANCRPRSQGRMPTCLTRLFPASISCRSPGPHRPPVRRAPRRNDSR